MFVLWIERQKEMNFCEERFQNEQEPSEFMDRWFRRNYDGEVWKLTSPDPGYFPGTWLPSNDLP